MSYLDPLTGLRTPLSIPQTAVRPIANSVLSPFTQALTTQGLPSAAAAFESAAPSLATQATRAIPSLATDTFMAADRGLANQLASAVSTGGPLSSMFNAAKVSGPAALGYGLLGQLGAGAIDRYLPGVGHNSNVEQALQGASIGAGLGAPFGPLGAGLGAVGGGAIGILGNLFGGGGHDDPRESGEDVLATAIQQASIDPDTAAKIIDTYDVLLTLASNTEDKDQRAALEQQALDQAGQMVLAAVGQRTQAQGAASNVLALQQQAGQIFQPIADDIRQSGAAFAQAQDANRQYLPESYRAFADADTAREVHSSNKLADAYLAQAAITPAVTQLTQYQQDFNSFAAQQFAQALAQQAAGGGGGGQVDVSAYLQPPT